LRIFGSKRDGVTEEWRELHKEEHNGLYCSPAVVRLIKSKMRWAGHVARMGQRRGAYGVLVGNPEGKTILEDPSADWRIISRWIFRKWDVGLWTGLIWLRIETGGGHL